MTSSRLARALVVAIVLALPVAASVPSEAAAQDDVLKRCKALSQAPSIHARWVKVTRITVVEGDASCQVARKAIRRYVGGKGLLEAGEIGSWRVSGGWRCSSGSSHGQCYDAARGVTVQVGWRFPGRRADRRSCAGGMPFDVSLVGCRVAGQVIVRAVSSIAGRRQARVQEGDRWWTCRRIRTTANDFTPVWCSNGRRQISFDLEGPSASAALSRRQMLRWRLSRRGLGPIRIGMGVLAIERVTRHSMIAGYGRPTCRLWTLAGAPRGLSIMTAHGRVARIGVYGPSPRWLTASGIGVGSSEAQVRRRYRVRSKPHPYTSGKYLITKGKKRRLVFETNSDGEVTSFRVGRKPHINYIEGCA